MRSPRWMTAVLCAAGPQLAFAHDFGVTVPIDGPFSGAVGIAGTAWDGQWRVLVADTLHNTVQWGPAESSAWASFPEGVLEPEPLHLPQGVAVFYPDVYVADTYGREVQRYTHVGPDAFVYDPDFAAGTRFSAGSPPVRNGLITDVAVDQDGNIYAYDAGNHRVLRADAPIPWISGGTEWTVWRAEIAFAGSTGLDVSPDGATVYLARTSSSDILRFTRTSSISELGTFGPGGGLREPEDVAWLPGGKMLVADTGNHRVIVVHASGAFDEEILDAPRLDRPEKLVRTADGVFVIDSVRSQVFALVSEPGAHPTADLFVRDSDGDDGTIPSSSAVVLASPDLVVHSEAGELTDTVRAEENNTVSITVHNRSAIDVRGARVQLYWAEPNAAELSFPGEWSSEGFYAAFDPPVSVRPDHTLEAPTVPAGGSVTVGPLIFRPRMSGSLSTGQVHLMARLSGDADAPPSGAGLAQVRESNNVALRTLPVLDGTPSSGHNVLAVRVVFEDELEEPVDLDRVRFRLNELGAWVKEVSYDTETFVPSIAGPVRVPGTPADYFGEDRTPLIELAQAAIDGAYALHPAYLDASVEHILVINAALAQPRPRLDWATTGPFPYRIGEQTRRVSLSIHDEEAQLGDYAHGYMNQLGAVDLHPYENVELVEPDWPAISPRGWDVLADSPYQPRANHPLTWTKEQLSWLTEAGLNIRYIPHPEVHSLIYPIELVHQSVARPGETAAVVIGLTPGARSIEEERHVYVAESRSAPAPSRDQVPDDGVIIYYANPSIPPGQMPVWLLDHGAATPTLISGSQPAHFGGANHDNISLLVDRELEGASGYSLAVNYEAFADLADVYIVRGDPPWTSPDIWMDHGRNGHVMPPAPTDDTLISGPSNKICARIHNDGPSTAGRFELAFMLSFPHQTAGGEDQFEEYKLVYVPSLAVGTSVTCVPAPFITREIEHGCVRVEIRRLENDFDPHDNDAQQNFRRAQSAHGSPYNEAIAPFQYQNTSGAEKLVYFVVEGAPPAWNVNLSADKVLLAPGQTISGQLGLKPDPFAPDCRDHQVELSAWTPVDDTLIRLGGISVEVELRQKTQLAGSAVAHACNEPGWSPPPNTANLRFGSAPGCVDLHLAACTQPPRPNQWISIAYTDGDGVPTYSTVRSDNGGCFSSAARVNDGGNWRIDAYYAGDSCLGEAQQSWTVPVALPINHDDDGDGIADGDELWGDTDNDGIANHRDTDSDNDGILDRYEGPPSRDSDRDGASDAYDWNGKRTGSHAFVWAGQPSTASYTPSAAYQHSTSGQNATVQRSATGVYDVRFPGVGASGTANGSNGHVQVSAYGANGGFCQIGSWGGTAETLLRVYCFASNGAPADRAFTARFQREARNGVLNDAGRTAYLWAGSETAPSYNAQPSYSYNDSGGINTLTRLSTGVYQAFFPGMIGDGGNFVVTAYGSTAARCNLGGWYPSELGVYAFVQCFNAAGAPRDTRFNLLFSEDRAGGVASSGMPVRGAYVWAGSPAVPSYSADEAYQFDGFVSAADVSSAITVQRASTGTYDVVIPLNGLTVNKDSPLVSAYGASGECHPAGWSRGQNAVVRVVCRGANGALADTAFSLNYISDLVP